MRDKVVHEYDEVDLNLVWEVARRDVPDLLRALRPLLGAEATG